MKKIVALFLAVLMLVSMTGSVQAASSGNPYKDVTKKAVGADAYRAIKTLKGWGAYKDLSTKKSRFDPLKKITRGECLAILANVFGDDKVPVTMTDVRKANSVATDNWWYKEMTKLANGLDVNLEKWTGKGTKMSRRFASMALMGFIDNIPEAKAAVLALKK